MLRHHPIVTESRRVVTTALYLNAPLRHHPIRLRWKLRRDRLG